MVVDFILPHVEFGPNDHQNDAPPLRIYSDRKIMFDTDCKFLSRIKNRKCARGDFSDWSWNDAMRAVAICDAKNGKTDADQLAARMELLNNNPDLESRPTHEMGTVMKQFFELSNETEDSDDQFPTAFYNQPDFETSDDESKTDSDEESEEESDEDSDNEEELEPNNSNDRICIRTVIKQEQERVTYAGHTLYGIQYAA